MFKRFKHDIDINKQNADGNTALMLAIQKSNFEAIKVICEILSNKVD